MDFLSTIPIEKWIIQILMWSIWIILPASLELFKILATIPLSISHYIKKTYESLKHYPYVTLLVPIYNSEKTLKSCLNSIVNSDYPMDSIEVFLIDNGSKDNSFEVFKQFQIENRNLKIWWFESRKGKANALNKGLFASKGQYIINIDSDGRLDSKAIENIVQTFENTPSANALTGSVLIDPLLLNNKENWKLKILQKCEALEYTECFLVGRNIDAMFNSMYTMAGAFSAFRREAVLKTQLYNVMTLGEDLHMTYQIKKFVGGTVGIASKAFFYVDPIEGINKLYTQRQRWQRSELEIAKLFSEFHLEGINSKLSLTSLKTLLFDHTLALSKVLWTLGLFYLFYLHYPAIYLVVGLLVLFTIYTLYSFVSANVSLLYLNSQPDTKKYIEKNIWIIFLMPFYRTITSFFALAGIVNSLHSKAEWKTNTISEEYIIVKEFIINLFCFNKKNIDKKNILNEQKKEAV